MRPQALLLVCVLISVPLLGLGVIGIVYLAKQSPPPAVGHESVKATPVGTMGLTAFLTAQPKEPVSFRVKAKLLGYHPETVAAERAIYYRIRLTETEGDGLTAVVKIKTEEGRRLFDFLKDGKTHGVRVDLQYGLPLYGSANIVRFAEDD